MDEKNGYDKHPDMVKIARELSGITNSAGKVGFAVTYTATPGNLSVHEAFQKFCFEKSNNEYLAGIGKLLEFAAIYNWLTEFDRRLLVLEAKVTQNGLQEERKEIKTF